MYLDVDILLALIKEKDFHREYAKKIISLKEDKYTSVISLIELEIVIKREVSDILSMELDKVLIKILPELRIVDCDNEIFNKSLDLRKKFNLGIFDSIHAATSLKFDKRIASTDHMFEKVKGLVVVKTIIN
ncbi:PIN domain-containing protein [Candidatus Woesearchaeota archaeon]|nr:MAG: hypothetical protein QT09_C0007G0046 [archaeon GW2011_AR18]MBS3161500.1 PIN domain-containing protein [Candidatus Woesearchaeota archaeon]HIH25455.1 PIN domain-containing protein [Nanoarchaeota archaeon]